MLDAPAGEAGRSWRWHVLILTALVVGIYFLRLTELPVMGEEGRRARGAINMLERGDWAVLKQQGLVFPDRPPMTNWLIALGTMVRGEADAIAIRLPSVLAVLATTLLLYWVGSRVANRGVGLMAGAIFPTLAQVMQLGRFGESEAVFTLFVGGSLLVWYRAFASGRAPAWGWIPGYALAALGALVKGLQAPVYFAAPTVLYLLWKRDWHWLFGRAHLAGLATFAAVVGAWQFPYALATDRESVVETWFGVIGPRLGFGGLVEHLVNFPLETLGCLAPWSLFLVALFDRDLRRSLLERQPAFAFAVCCVLVTYPSVWWSVGAKGRYYMPLYPLVALLIALTLGALTATPAGRLAARVRTTVLHAPLWLAVFAVTAMVAGKTVLPIPQLDVPWPWIVAGLVVGWLAWTTFRGGRTALLGGESAPMPAIVLALAAVLGLTHTTLWMASFGHARYDVGPEVLALRERLDQPQRLVSFGPIDSRFTYPYRDFVPELPWPGSVEDVPAELAVFAFDVRPTDTAEARENWRGMKMWHTSGVLPFRWREVGRVNVSGKRFESPPSVQVVIGVAERDARGRLIPRGDVAPPPTSGSGKDGRGDADSATALPG